MRRFSSQFERSLASGSTAGKYFLRPYNSPESLERYQRIVAELVASRASKPEAVHPDGPTVVKMLRFRHYRRRTENA